jgi:predicted metal-dependent hydrolase
LEGPSTSVQLVRGYIVIKAPAALSSLEIKRLVQQWYRERAEVILRERLTACHQLAARHGVPLPPLTIRRMKTRWGSCTKSRRMLLNPELVKVTKDCIDYVILHELCHLKENHHGPRFWTLLRRVLPDWRQRRTELNRLASE